MTTPRISPTSSLLCVSDAKAAELATRLVAETGRPATARFDRVTVPVDDLPFVFHVAGIAVDEGYATDRDAVGFQSAGINLANDLRSRWR